MHRAHATELVLVLNDVHDPDIGDFWVPDPHALAELQQPVLPVEDYCDPDNGALLLRDFHGVFHLAGTFEFMQKLEAYFTLTRDFYEAILLFTFFYLIFSYLAYNRDEVLSP